jgi:GTP-binding protein
MILPIPLILPVIINATFVTSAASARDLPRDGLAEVALVGRSNVGKSSLINALVRQRVARTSAAPGKTRLANFYRVQRGTAPALYLVDLPGYGYARGGDASAREFNALTEAYFSRADEKDIAVVLLVDSRHPGLESDLDAWTWMRKQPVARGIVATKVDKLTRAERVRHTRQLESSFDAPVLLVSAQSGEGLEELWKLIARLPKETAA